MARSENQTRCELIDPQLSAAGWQVQDYAAVNLSAGRGIAVREFPLTNGIADYMLFVDRKAVGVVEAKPEGATLAGVAEQTVTYLTGLCIPPDEELAACDKASLEDSETCARPGCP